ncbi:ABC transporter substrate-binding protein [Methylobacterium mesophilicum SR1.6/6]|uniref:ABC transporter substrate-binding protein n=1 Tax=Methylobacterium mesophilicum SR1.6/6 TaxID=908290 RepID=A0A6B9FK87_9HYPH|nr:ABC transporter substrate-binding protein [Methylobacterium mesophilicum]QGY02379.1 ABC transporter substrate-binding protein [Methylobacterium mesophilicum SR1.6/6]
MRRRTVIAGLPWMLAGRPMAAHAQAPSHVAALWPFAAADAEGRALAAAFRSALREHGQADLRIDDRWGEADRARTRALAAELVAAKPRAILTYLSAQLAAVSELTREIPVVFVGASDPVGFGVVASLQRPGGNITGFTLYEPPLGGKWLAALKEAVPSIRHVTLLANPSSGGPGANFYAASFTGAATALGVRSAIVTVDTAAAIDPVVRDLASLNDAGLIVAPGTFSEANGDRIVALTASHRIPTVFAIRRFAHRGGLMSYGPDPAEAVRRAGGYVDRIVRGDNPATLPVQAPTKFDFIVNLKTARSLGIAITSALLAQADEVVE